MAGQEDNSDWKVNTILILGFSLILWGIVLYFSLTIRLLGLTILLVVLSIALPTLALSYFQVYVNERSFRNIKQQLNWRITVLVIVWGFIAFYALIVSTIISYNNLSSSITIYVSIMVVATFWLIEKASAWTMETMRLYREIHK